MAKSREPWNIRPAKKKDPVSDSVTAEVETKAKELIEHVIKPKHVEAPPADARFNYITDIRAKWYRNYGVQNASVSSDRRALHQRRGDRRRSAAHLSGRSHLPAH
jgi:hypothetical protein